jgi:hypothetical protein
LTARLVVAGMMVNAKPGGLGLSASPVDAFALLSPVPTVWASGQAELGCLVMSSPGPTVCGSEHGAIRRSQQRSITYGRPQRSCRFPSGLLAASELAHASWGWARQRISPSRSP